MLLCVPKPNNTIDRYKQDQNTQFAQMNSRQLGADKSPAVSWEQTNPQQSCWCTKTHYL